MSTTELTPVREHPPQTPDLNEATAPKDVIRYLLEHAGLTPTELEGLIGADSRTIRRWATPDDSSVPQPRFHAKIDDLRALVVLIKDTLPGEQTGRWLRARNRYLRNARPIELLQDDNNFDKVHEAGEAYIVGAPI